MGGAKKGGAVLGHSPSLWSEGANMSGRICSFVTAPEVIFSMVMASVAPARAIPRSMFETAAWLMPNAAAACVCESLAFFRQMSKPVFIDHTYNLRSFDCL